ncbi:MAG: GGDEF domain-containing protein [Minisyncoccia bacterium]
MKKINEIIDTIKKLIDYAFYDELTKCLNRRGFKWRANELNLFSKKNREKRKIFHCIILADIDNLKYVNDNFGYNKGDKLIKTVASNLKRKFRKEDIICRWGGDEFLILALNVNKKNFPKKIKEIKEYIDGKIEKFKSSLSIGYSFFKPSENFKKIFEKTNKGVKISKKTGKGKIIKVN